MISHSMTAVLEKSERFSENFETEPYEVAWAHEARWFIRVLERSGDEAPLKFYPQISPDGLFWCDEGSEPLVVNGPGLYSFSWTRFWPLAASAGRFCRGRDNHQGLNLSGSQGIKRELLYVFGNQNSA